MKLLVPILLLLLTVPAFAAHRRYLRSQTPMLFKALGSLQLQDAEVERLGLERFQNATRLKAAVGEGLLVPLPVNIAVRASCKRERAFLRSWAAEDVNFIGRGFYRRFGKPITVSSAVRPIDYQRNLRRHNGSAAPAIGEVWSVHPAGIAFDISRRHLTREQTHWLQWHLWYLQAIGWVIVEQERHCFHIASISRTMTQLPSSSTGPSCVQPSSSNLQ
jgi:hypothetical protein